MRKNQRVKKNEEFQQVFKHGQSFANRQFVIYVLSRKDGDLFRIGLSISKKIGNAVVRNQIKRYVRQCFFEMKDQIHDGNEYVIVARKPAADMDYFEVKKSLTHVLKRAKVLKRLPLKSPSAD